MMFLLGRQAILGHDPPMYLRSITATRCPFPARVQAAIVDPVPPPRITRSKSSGPVFFGDCAAEEFSVVFMASLIRIVNVIFVVSPARWLVGVSLKKQRARLSDSRTMRLQL